MRRLTTPILVIIGFCGVSVGVAAEARVEIELATSGTFPVTAQQEWYKALTELGVDSLRIRKEQSGDKVEVKVAGSTAAPVYRVVGKLASGTRLELPGGSFSPKDRAGLAKWLAKLRTEGPQSSGATKTPFGLNAKQFAAVNADLASRIDFSTTGISAANLLGNLSGALNYSLTVDPAMKERLAKAEPIAEELQGLTSGTAIAYALRSEGLGLLPRIGPSKKPEYTVVKPAGGELTWPVGWPLEDRKPQDLLPELFVPHNAEIEEGVALSDALDAISGLLKAPVLYDHYALARQGIDVTKAPVKFPAARTWYAKVLDKVLHQAGLKGEWRLDDSGKPLLWVTTLKPVR